MREKLTRNIGLKILSIILAAILWLIITNVDDPVISRSFYNVPVEILNEDAIASLDQVYEITEGKTIDFTVAARRTIIDNINVSDFNVTADFSKLSDVNAVTIDIKSPRYGEDVTVTDGLYQVMKVNLEDLAERHLRVDVIQKGDPAEGYYVAEKTASTIIQVSGPKSKIESIAQIAVEVDVTDVAGSFRTTEEPKALDAEGNEIDASNLRFSDNALSVNIVMYKTKTIDLHVTTSGKPADGYIMTEVEYEPKTIEIAGDDEALQQIQSLTVIESIDGAKEDIAKEVNLAEQLEDGLILVADNQTAVINIKIERSQTKELLIDPKVIDIRNTPEDLNAVVLSMLPIPVKVIGPAAEITDLTAKSLKPYVDLTEHSSGTYDIAIGIDTTGYTVLLNQPKLSIHLNQK